MNYYTAVYYTCNVDLVPAAASGRPFSQACRPVSDAKPGCGSVMIGCSWKGVFWFLPTHRRPARSGPTRVPPASRSLVDMQSLGSQDRQHELLPAYPLRITAGPRILPHLGPSHKRTRLARTGSVVVHSDVGSGSGWLNDNGRERVMIPVTTSGRGRNGASGGTDQ